MIPRPPQVSPVGVPLPDDDRVMDLRREEPPRSRLEALQRYFDKAFSGETLQVQLDGCEAFLSIGIPIGDKEHKKSPIENWEAWRDNATAVKRRVTSNIGVAQTMIHKEGEAGNRLLPIGGAADASSLESHVRDPHVTERAMGLERTQLRAAVDVLKDLVGELMDVLVERGYFPDMHEDVNLPADTPPPLRMPSRRFELGPPEIQVPPEEEGGEGDEE